MAGIDEEMVRLLETQIELRQKQGERVQTCESAGVAALDSHIKQLRDRYSEGAKSVCDFMVSNGHDNAVVHVGDEQWSIRLSKKNYERAVPRKHLRAVLERLMAAEEAERVYNEVCPPQPPEYCIRCKPKVLTRKCPSAGTG